MSQKRSCCLAASIGVPIADSSDFRVAFSQPFQISKDLTLLVLHLHTSTGTEYSIISTTQAPFRVSDIRVFRSTQYLKILGVFVRQKTHAGD
jgi:hypothetical protein